MKANLFFSLVLFFIITVSACNNKKQDSASATKDQTGMMGMNMGSDTAMMGNMMKDSAMMQNMMTMMMEQCEKDTAMCRNMCTRMMKSPKMKAMMMDMMKGDGMMDMKSGDKMEGMKMDEK